MRWLLDDVHLETSSLASTRGVHCSSLGEPVDVLVVDQPDEIGLVVGDLQRLFVDALAGLRIELGAALGDQRRPSPRCCSTSRCRPPRSTSPAGGRGRAGRWSSTRRSRRRGSRGRRARRGRRRTRGPRAGRRGRRRSSSRRSPRAARGRWSQRPDSPTSWIVAPADAGLLEQALGLLGVVRVGLERLVVAEDRRRQQLAGVDGGEAAERAVGDGVLVDGEVERLAHVDVGRDALVGVEDDDRVLLARDGRRRRAPARRRTGRGS